MTHKHFVAVWLGLLLLSTTAFSQTGFAPGASSVPTVHPNAATPPYYSNGQTVNPAYSGGVSGRPKMDIPSVPNSGFVPPEQNAPISGSNSYNPTIPQRAVSPIPQNGAYVPQQPTVPSQPAGQQQQFGNPQSFVQPQSNAPFELTPQQQDQVNKVLAFWESYTRGIKKFEADFDLYSYPAVSVGGTDVNSAPRAQQTTGFLKYEAPNKGVFRVDGPPKELYRCNGKSVYTYNFDKKEINEYKYSDGAVTGQELKKGPMAFLFGASAATLRDRYWIRLLPLPPGAPQGQIWLEAYPKYQEDLQDMTKAELIINVKPCKPVAFQRYSPNGDRQSYALKNIKVNKFELFGGEPFEPNERGWTVITSSQPE